MKEPRTLRGFISLIKMIESVDISSLKKGGVKEKTKQNLIHLQAQISNEIDNL